MRFKRAPLARHGRLRSPKPFVQLIAVLGVAALVGIVSITGVLGFQVWDAARTVQASAVSIGDDEVVLPPEIGQIEGGVNLLLVGTDSCEGQDLTIFPRCIDDEGGERNDVTLLVHIADNPRRVTVVSFPRDMMVSIPTCTNADGDTVGGTYEKLNASYMYGGLACSVQTIERLTGEDIQFAGAIRWTGVINMSDAVGGVDVCVSGDIDDEHSGVHLTAGIHTLQGVEALQFLRIRHGIGDGSDLGRISNQQQFMASLVRKLQSGDVFGNPATLLGFANTAVEQVRNGQLVLSTELANPTRMVQIAMALRGVPYSDIVFVQYPTGYSGDTVVPITSAATALFQALADNKALVLTGDASGGFGVEVTGEAADPNATTEPSDAATSDGTVADADATDAAADGEVVASDSVELPSSVTGSTAAEITCTVPQS